jgi:hypothetical protein
MAVENWQEAGPNNTIEGVNVAEGMLPPALNNVIRLMAAALKTFYNKTYRKQETIFIITNVAATPTMTEDDILIRYIP